MCTAECIMTAIQAVAKHKELLSKMSLQGEYQKSETVCVPDSDCCEESVEYLSISISSCNLSRLAD